VVPPIDVHNRMKEALVLLGRLPRAVVRPPLVKIKAEEIARQSPGARTLPASRISMPITRPSQSKSQMNGPTSPVLSDR
jgi:hypothetical protein